MRIENSDHATIACYCLEMIKMNLKELRSKKRLTQKEAADLVKMPLRTYQNYENQLNREGTIKYQYLMEKLTEYGFVDEEHGILSLDMIEEACREVFDEYDIAYCYLFGSYAKNLAHEESDVDLLISATVSGLDFYGMVEKLRRTLQKNVDVLTVNQLVENTELLDDLLKYGIKIYG